MTTTADMAAELRERLGKLVREIEVDGLVAVQVRSGILGRGYAWEELLDHERELRREIGARLYIEGFEDRPRLSTPASNRGPRCPFCLREVPLSRADLHGDGCRFLETT